ncbi:ATP-binding protein, partial [Candidatus Micrarchaeota archaeon]|nr:ATP-binding protein [Candidatus Micrarchaeota archaeon]
WIPCTITAPVKTGWEKNINRFGPRPKSKLPANVSPRLAGLMGYILGDGWMQKHRACFLVAEDEIDVLPELVSIIKREFKINPSVRKIKIKEGRKKQLTEVNINDADVAKCLSFLAEKRAPDLILRSGNKAVAEFISWLFEADGCVFSKGRGKRAVQLKSANIELLRDVQMLLLRFGIHSRIIERNLRIARAESIKKFAEHIGFKSVKKKGKLKQLVKDCEKLREQNIRGKQLSERVVLVRKAGYSDVFDVEVPKSHRFIANGIVSHNTAKSQLLQYVQMLSPKGIYVSGKSSSAAGLTATAEKDDFGEGGWTLKAGALVLAAGGMAMIDEFDKMGDEDRSSMHEAMESQEIHVAKAGIIATFKANASILAAANPKYGRFDPNELPAAQFEIPPTIMSRFDLIFPIKDVLDEKRDREMADHILTSHFTSGMKLKKDYNVADIEAREKRVQPIIDKGLLRNYIAYARINYSPVLTEEAMAKIKDFYLELRKMGEGQGSVPITARYLEGIVRLSEASAKGRLSDTVGIEDAERAIKLLKYSLKEIGMDPETGRLDIDIIATGQSHSRVDKIRTVMKLIKRLNADFGEAKHEDIIEECKVQNLKPEEAEEIINQLKRGGEIYSPKYGVYKPTEETKG